MVLFLRPSFSIWCYPLHVALIELDYIDNNACHLCHLEKSYTNLADIPFTVKKRSAMLLDNVVRTPTPLIDNFNRYVLASLVRDVSPTVSAATSAKVPWRSRLTEQEAAMLHRNR
jgi:hypothetical protein